MSRLSNLPPGVTDEMIERAQGYDDPCECDSIKQDIENRAVDSHWDEARLYSELDEVECDYCKEQRRLDDAYWTWVDSQIDERRGK